MIYWLLVPLVAAAFGALGHAASLTFSGSVQLDVIEFPVGYGQVETDESGFIFGSCSQSGEGKSLELHCEYTSHSSEGSTAYVHAYGYGDLSRFGVKVSLVPIQSYYEEAGLVLVDPFLVGEVTARVHGQFYVGGGYGRARFKLPDVLEGYPDWSAFCTLLVDGISIRDSCGGSFEATFGAPFHMDYQVRMTVRTTVFTTGGESTTGVSTVSSGQRSYPLYVVPEGATGGLVVVGLAGLVGWGRWRRRGDGLERLRGSLSSD